MVRLPSRCSCTVTLHPARVPLHLEPFQLENSVHIADCIVFGDDSLVLNRKDQIQFLEPAGYKRRASLGCGNSEFTIEFLDVFFAEEPICLVQASDSGQAQLLW